MAKAKTVWECSQCGERYPKFLGRCDNCGAWNTLTEVVIASSPKSPQAQALAPRLNRTLPQSALPHSQVSSDRHPRLSTG